MVESLHGLEPPQLPRMNLPTPPQLRSDNGSGGWLIRAASVPRDTACDTSASAATWPRLPLFAKPAADYLGMQDLLASVIAVVGTLLGSLSPTYFSASTQGARRDSLASGCARSG